MSGADNAGGSGRGHSKQKGISIQLAPDSPTAPPLARGDNLWLTTLPAAMRWIREGIPGAILVLARMWKEANIHLPGVVEHGNPRGKWSSLVELQVIGHVHRQWELERTLRALFRPCPDSPELHEGCIYKFI